MTTTTAPSARLHRPPPERGDLYRVLLMATWPLYAVALGAFFAWLML